MKEFLKKKWYIILGLILLIASVVVSVILYIKLDECSDKKCEECETCEEVKCEEEIEPEEDDEEKPQLPSDDETYSFVSIVKADEFGVPYDYNEASSAFKALKNGYLTGDWYVEELKDTKFIGTAGVNVDIGPGAIFALSETGEIYKITAAADWNEAISSGYHKLNTNIIGKITKMENIMISPDDHSIPFYLNVPVLTVNDNKCVLNVEYNGGDVVYTCEQSLKEFYEENSIFTVGHYAHAEGIGLDYAKVDNNHYITFQDSDDKLTNILNFTAIKVQYTIYTVNEDNKEVLYIVSSDNKLYIVDNVDSTNLRPYGDVETVSYSGTDEEGLGFYKSKIINITLTSGESLKFKQN